MSYFRDELCVKRLKACLALKCAEFHVFHGGLIIYFIVPWIYKILLQMFMGALFLGCVYIKVNKSLITYIGSCTYITMPSQASEYNWR